MILSINHIQLVAEKDLVIQLKDFYCNVVGLTEGFRPAFERFGFWLYIGDKDVLHLITPKDGDDRSLWFNNQQEHRHSSCDKCVSRDGKNGINSSRHH